MFKDRADAGKKLAKKLENYKNNEKAIVATIPRGGVATGFEVAKYLNLPLDVVVTKKIGAPGNPEYAIGSINRHGDILVDEDAVLMTGASQEYLEEQSKILKQKVEEKLKMLKGDKPVTSFKDKVVILVDDGIATGYTALAAAKFLKDEGAKKVVMAMPVVPADNIDKFKDKVDEFIYLESPVMFASVGQFYQDFTQVEDEEAKELLAKV
ncbi:MAG: phosphoribosyltransferase family protein [Patescibacteria group bacterium]